MIRFAGWVTACIPHYRCRRDIRRAVESLLCQTYPWVRVIVVNDGDPDPPWPELQSIYDPRLICFGLDANSGPYFGTEVASRATPDPFFLIQDADDWSDKHRVECLLSLLQRDASNFAVCAQPQVVQRPRGNEIVDVRWKRESDMQDAEPFTIQQRLSRQFRYRAPHHGLFRNSALRAVGGYYVGMRISYDTLIPNLILMTGSISHTRRELYYRVIREESLTHSPGTGVRSTAARAEDVTKRAIYEACYDHYERYVRGRCSATYLLEHIRRICNSHIPSAHASVLDIECRRLRRALGDPHLR